MLKKIAFLFLALIGFQSSIALATEHNKNLTLRIEFNSKANGTIYEHPLRINKTIKIDPSQESNTIVMTESKIDHNFPVTIIMMVKPVDITKDKVDLRFNLLQYGFNQRSNVITQPQIVLKNGQTGELKYDLYTLKVKAKWA